MLIFDEYIFQTNLSQLMLETKISYSDEMKDVLSRLNTKISNSLIGLINKNIKSDFTHYDILTRNDMVKFMRIDKRKEYFRLKTGYIYGNFTALYKEFGIDGDKVTKSMNGNPIGTVKKVYNFNSDKISHFVSVEGEEMMISQGGLIKAEGGNLQEARVGRAFRKLLKDANIEFTDADVEEFVNAYKARIDVTNDKFRLLEVVEGEDIRHWYLHKNNCNGGELEASCMAGDRCQEFLNIYTENPEVCKLLILKDEDDATKIRARALIWTLENGETFLDRSYGTKMPEMNLLRIYAEEQGWHYRSADSDLMKDGKKISRCHDCDFLIVKFKETEFESYPYMDTLGYIIRSVDNKSESDINKGLINTIANKKSISTRVTRGTNIVSQELDSTGGRPYRYTIGPS